MTDTSTETVARLAHQMDNLGFDDVFELLHALAAERDKWHAGWMEAEAKVSELEAERDALKALLDSVDDLSSALEQYNVKYNALAEENDALKAEVERLREEREWADQLAETLMAVNTQHGGRNAARLLRDYRDHCAKRAALQEDTDD